jgi:uncharacterized membrane protein
MDFATTLPAFALDPYVRDWADLLIRWLHVIAAIGWIGSSFYFVLLDQSLRTPKDPKDVEDGVGGELWEVHGGGFYHVKKYKVAPPELPDHLAWFKWEAYTTWISGFALMVALYWFDAKSHMIDPRVADLSGGQAVAISAGLLLVAWGVYDIACRLLRNRPELLSATIAVGVIAAAWGTSELYSARAAWLQVGSMIGTIMVANVFFNIIPAHRELIRAKEAGRDPDPAPGIEAKRRSVHNNYFTLPVLITMLAGHFSFLTGHAHGWVIMLVLMALGAWIRHFYNQRHAGRTKWWMLAVFALVILGLAVGLRPSGNASSGASAASGDAAAGAEVFAVAGCGTCHAMNDAGSTAAVGPNLDTLKPNSARVIAAVTNGKGGMPSFSGKLDAEEIRDVAAYVTERAGNSSEASGR